MNEGEQAGRRAQVLLCMVLFAVWFNVACIVASIYKEWFL
jgi:hypothetical protein